MFFTVFHLDMLPGSFLISITDECFVFLPEEGDVIVSAYDTLVSKVTMTGRLVNVGAGSVRETQPVLAMFAQGLFSWRGQEVTNISVGDQDLECKCYGHVQWFALEESVHSLGNGVILEKHESFPVLRSVSLVELHRSAWHECTGLIRIWNWLARFWSIHRKVLHVAIPFMMAILLPIFSKNVSNITPKKDHTFFKPVMNRTNQLCLV